VTGAQPPGDPRWYPNQQPNPAPGGGYGPPQQRGHPPTGPVYPPGQPGYPGAQQGFPGGQPGQPAYPGQPGYPSGGQWPGYPPADQQGYPAPGQPGYPQPQQTGYSTGSQPAYPQAGQGGYQQPGQGGYGQPGQPSYAQATLVGAPQLPDAKRKRNLLIAIVVAAVVLIGGGATLLIVLLNKDGGGPAQTAQGTADVFIKAVNDKDFDTLRSISCASTQGSIDTQRASIEKNLTRWEGGTLGPITFSENDTVAKSSIKYGSNSSSTVRFYKNQKGSWLFCDDPLEEVDQSR
jgi:flagellar basal body-associated protein FliL